MPDTFNPPPGWPTPPEGWTPPAGWVPDPTWPPAPAGWNFWVEQDADPTPDPVPGPEGFTPPSAAGVGDGPSTPAGPGGVGGGVLPIAPAPQPATRRRFSTGTLVVATVAALVVGGAGGFAVSALGFPRERVVIAEPSMRPTPSGESTPSPVPTTFKPRKVDRPKSILLPGRTGKIGSVDVTLGKTNKDATDEVLKLNTWSTIPSDRVAILVPVTLKNNGNEPIRMSHFLVDYVGDSDIDYAWDFEAFCPSKIPEKFPDTDLRKGESASGNLCALIPKDDVANGYWKVRAIKGGEPQFFAVE